MRAPTLPALWATGMLRGHRTKEILVAKCNQTTMTQADIRDGLLSCHVSLVPVNLSEFVYY